MMHDERIRYFAPADYTENHELEKLVKNIIERTETNERLERFHVKCLHKMKQDDRQKSFEEKQKEIFINQLEESGSFKTTHDVISKLSAQKMWSPEQKIDCCILHLLIIRSLMFLMTWMLKPFIKKSAKIIVLNLQIGSEQL